MTPSSADRIARYLREAGHMPHIATEIEFYLHGNGDGTSCYEAIARQAQLAGIAIASIEKERGEGQHEISLLPSPDIDGIAAATDTLKRMITDIAAAQGLTADFTAKPLPDQPGSGLHVHVHLAGDDGRNLYYKDDERISSLLKSSIGGLLACLPASMAVFAPQAASYARFAPGNNAPLTVSWGANNRTVAVRLPDADHHNKHIEHRVAGADADVPSVIAHILAAIHYGITRTCDPGAQIHGDASLPMYRLPRLPASLEEAQALYHASPFIAEYF